MVMLALLGAYLTVTALSASPIARWITPRGSSLGVRRLAWSLGWLVASAVVVALAAVGALRVMPRAAVDDALRLNGDHVTNPAASQLASLPTTSVRPRCDIIRTGWEGEGGGAGGWAYETTLRRCGPGRFAVRGHGSYDPWSQAAGATWTHGSWQCTSESSEWTPNGQPWGGSRRSHQVQMRASNDGSFAEYTCHPLQCLECLDGACHPISGGCPHPPPLYLRARDVGRPAARAALGVALLALMTLAVLRCNAVRGGAHETRAERSPYRTAELTGHDALMSAATVVFLALHVIAWVTATRGGYLARHPLGVRVESPQFWDVRPSRGAPDGGPLSNDTEFSTGTQ
ncbi:MAG: hypothetical protein JWM10_236 [Myxococcaceae bacterium]|nr:hypothetical protein [Myxococcaceae bacterium]